VLTLLADRDSIRQPNSSRTLKRMQGTARRDSPRSGNSHKGTRCLKACVDSRRVSRVEVSPAYVIHFDPFTAASGTASVFYDANLAVRGFLAAPGGAWPCSHRQTAALDRGPTRSSTHSQNRRRGNRVGIRAPAGICDQQLFRSNGLRLCVSDCIDKRVCRWRRRHFAAQNAVCGDFRTVERVH
jgi:hypothetical protein